MEYLSSSAPIPIQAYRQLDLFSPEGLFSEIEVEVNSWMPKFCDPALFPALSEGEVHEISKFRYSRHYMLEAGGELSVSVNAWVSDDHRMRSLEILLQRDSKPIEFTIVTPTPKLFSKNLKDCLMGVFRSNLEKSCKVDLIVSAGPDFNYSRAVNRGMSKSLGDIILLNDDCYLNPGTISSMVSARVSSENIVGCLLVYPDGSIQHSGGKVVLNPVRILYRLAVEKRAPVYGLKLMVRLYVQNSRLMAIYNSTEQKPGKLDFVTAALCLIPRKIYDTVGGFDEGFNNELDDVDFCFRARSMGFGLAMVTDSPAFHEEHASLKKISIDNAANYSRFVAKWFPRKQKGFWHKQPRVGVKILEAVANAFSV